MPPVRNAQGQFAKTVHLYDVTVWDCEGNVVKYFSEVEFDELETIRENYDDGPYMIQEEFIREETA